MKKILLLSSLISSYICGMQLEVYRPELNEKPLQSIVFLQDNKSPQSLHIDSGKVEIDAASVFVPNRLGELKLFHGKKGFMVIKDNQKHLIERYNTDKTVRNMTKEELLSFLAVGYVSLNQMDSGEYSLKANGRLNGGGAIGAAIGAFLGKAVVSLVGHGTIVVIGALTGPAAPATIIALESVFGAAIEGASMAGAVAGGLALGVATGPV